MITTKTELKLVIDYEKKIYIKLGYKGKWHAFFSQCEVGYIFKYIEALRHDEYYSNNQGSINRILGAYWRRKHNKLGVKLGISIPINTFQKGLTIYHSQGIIVHKDARIGKNCCLHGMNCIGNNGKENGTNNTPVIGDSCDIGVGASVIGSVKLNDGIRIAAGAVVCNDCNDENTILVGIPAKVRK